MCEIAKAISHKAEVIVFDEPSAALTEKEIADLFEIIRDLRKKRSWNRLYFPPYG
mgnify:CR=1 FL=1